MAIINLLLMKRMFYYFLRIHLSAGMILCFAAKNHAQEKTPDYKNEPVWITMMGDPNTNYFEAVEAYETYWKYHEKPGGEEEELERNAPLSPYGKMTNDERKKKEEFQREREKEMRRENRKKLSESELLKLEEKREMTYQCKRFEDWMREVKPFVQNDGRILSEEERMEIYNRQMEERQKQK